ncbi:MAG: methionyl-tRNA formyltransferase [Boseongicola sp.]|nr:methionyl-tRNA formyltransferase [Boseongicola sp.]
MKVVFMGTPDFSVPALDALVNAGHSIVAVYTQPPRPAGRGKKDRKSPVHVRADELGLEVRCPKSFKVVGAESDFASLDADVSVVVAYGLILPVPVLVSPKFGCLNIHASLLPRWRGAAPIHRAVMAGDSETGVCIMQMDQGLDTGPVLLREATPIGPEDTTGDLHDRLAKMGSSLIVDAIDRLDELEPKVQPEEGVTYAVKIDKAEAKIDWKQAAEHVDRQIRALSPFPGAWTEINGDRLKLLRSRVSRGVGQPGEHLGNFEIACGSGSVQVIEAQKSGKRPMQADVVLRGLTLPRYLD